IKMRALVDAGHHIGIGTRADLPAFMAVADDLAVTFGAKPDMVTRLRTVGRDGEALIARGDELDRAVELTCSQRHQRRARGHRAFGTEGATHKAAHHVNLVCVDAEPLRNAGLEAIDELARLMDRDLVAGPDA